MLAVTTYEAAYVAAARADVRLRIDAFAALRAGAGRAGASAVDAFEATYFNDQVIRLEAAFVHRMRGREGKDGNPLNEVRLLAASLLEHDGKVEVEKAIKWKADKTVLGLDVGDTITLTADDFARLADAFFTDLVLKYG